MQINEAAKRLLLGEDKCDVCQFSDCHLIKARIISYDDYYSGNCKYFRVKEELVVKNHVEKMRVKK